MKQSEDITVRDVKNLIEKYNYRLLIIPIISIFLGIEMSQHFLPTWEVTSYVQIGHVETQPIENIDITLAQLRKKDFEAQMEKIGTDLIEIKIKGIWSILTRK